MSGTCAHIPNTVPPVVMGGIRYEIPQTSRITDRYRDCVIVAAVDEATEHLVWTEVIYKIDHGSKNRSDADEASVKSMLPTSNMKALKIVTQAGKTYQLDLTSRRVKKIWLNL